MSVSSPYAVFRAADQGWPPAVLPVRDPDPARPRPSRRRRAPGAIQGELFSLALP